MITKKNKFLITGAAGFIGAALVRRMLKEGIHVIGIDNLNSDYDVNLKKQRLKLIDEENLSFDVLYVLKPDERISEKTN